MHLLGRRDDAEAPIDSGVYGVMKPPLVTTKKFGLDQFALPTLSSSPFYRGSSAWTIMQDHEQADENEAGPSSRPLELDEYRRYGRQMIQPEWGLTGKLLLLFLLDPQTYCFVFS